MKSPIETNSGRAEMMHALPHHVQEALNRGPSPPEMGLTLDHADELLNPGYLPMETGYTRLRNGQMHVACLTKMRGCKGRMVNWWFGWMEHSEHYQLWHPGDHVWTKWEDGYPGPNNDPDDANYVGYASLVHEYIGGEMNKLRIHFKDPSAYLDVSRFESCGVGAAICARVGYLDKPVKFAHLIHFVRDTEDGCEMRSRFWAGDVEIALPVIGSLLGFVANTRAVRSKLATDDLGRHLVIHCAEEMNHLAMVLPDLFRENTQ